MVPATCRTSPSGVAVGMGTAVPGTTGTPAAVAACRAAVLRPMSRMASGVGPMKVRPARAHAAANSAFSARKP